MKKEIIDLNSDIGEGFGIWKAGDGHDDEIMKLISSANVAAGFHAGDPSIIHHTVKQAKAYSVGIGVHPGFRDLAGFGRRFMKSTNEELINDVVYQIGALMAFTTMYNIKIQHIKPHGALYMLMADDSELSECFVQAVQKITPDAFIFCMENTETYRVAKRLGQPVVREFYGDRHYDNNGKIVFTRNVGKLNADEIAQKVLIACTEGKVKTVEGDWIAVDFDSVCIHSDTPDALNLIATTNVVLKNNNIKINNYFNN